CGVASWPSEQFEVWDIEDTDRNGVAGGEIVLGGDSKPWLQDLKFQERCSLRLGHNQFRREPGRWRCHGCSGF
ncbi:unnamed protein product, partial [Urochloa humidicola]